MSALVIRGVDGRWLGAGEGVVDLSFDAPDVAGDIDARGLLALPGFTDLYARLREPGYGDKGTLASECRAALGAGFTRVLAAPDTSPAMDSTATLELVRRRAAIAPGAAVLPIAALTPGLEGLRLSELATMQAAGCVAAGQADRPLASAELLYNAMQYASSFDLLLVMNPRDAELGASGCAHAGAMATRLGLAGVPRAAETVALARLIELQREIGGRLHVSRLSCARSVEMVREARRDGLAISSDVGIHHLFFVDEQLAGFDSRYVSQVPFRSRDDREALRAGVRDGTIDAICSDHAPQDSDACLAPLPLVAAGLSAYDRFLSLLLALPAVADIPFGTALAAVTSGPARVLGLPASTRDLVLVDADAGISKDEASWLSKGRNSPLFGLDRLHDVDGHEHRLLGVVRHAIVDGRALYDGSTAAIDSR